MLGSRAITKYLAVFRGLCGPNRLFSTTGRILFRGPLLAEYL